MLPDGGRHTGIYHPAPPMSEELHSSAEVFAPSAAAAPLIVVKRRRRVEPGGPQAPAAGGDGGVRQPRVFVLSSPRPQAPEAVPAPAAEEPGPLVPSVGRRPRTRQLHRRPGEVVHILGPASDTTVAAPEDSLGFELDDGGYPQVMVALQAVRALIEEAQAAARLQRSLKALPKLMAR